MKTQSKIKSITGRTKCALAVTVLALSSLAMPAHAAKFGVRVVDENNQAVVGAAVCIGLQGNYKQFAATFTDGQGKVMVDVPNVPLLVIAENTPGVPTIVVTDIAIYENKSSKTLSPTVSGDPNQYRVSANKDFEGAAWTKYTSQIALAGRLLNNDKVYLQKLGNQTKQANLESKLRK